MAPALLGPEEVHADALDHDAQQQRAAQHAEEAERQRDQAGDQALLALLLALAATAGSLMLRPLQPRPSA
jgi:hypothetical protein